MESVNKSALWFDSILEQLKQVGIFDEINGIII
jgi:muramoyltetrapeptide carboxypeptidase LdcA involved in peptidoglycan recycling